MCEHAAASLWQSVSSSPLRLHLLQRLFPARHSWLKFCSSCSSGDPAVRAAPRAAARAVNCWLQFHSDLESARQQSKAFAFKALGSEMKCQGFTYVN